jgi:hypothetical protein
MITHQIQYLLLRLLKKAGRSIVPIAVVFLIVFSSSNLFSQKLTGYDKRYWKKNIIWLEGLGASGAVGVHYERIFQVGRLFSFRADVGASPFYMTERYELYAGKSITGIYGGGFYIFPNTFKIGIGCSVLNDFFFNRIPETIVTNDTTHGGSTEMYPAKIYKVRIMPYIVIEGTILNRLVIRAGYSPIIDPANDAQTETYFTHWATFGVGYKFGK